MIIFIMLFDEKLIKENCFSDKLLPKAQFYPLVKDAMYKSCFNFKYPEFVGYFIAKFFNLDYNYVLKNIKPINYLLIKDRVKEAAKTVDFICELDEVLYVIEMNNQADIDVLVRNMDYLYKVAGTNRDSGSSTYKKIRLVNLNNFSFESSTEEYELYVLSRMKKSKFIRMYDGLEIYHIYLPILKEKCYTNCKLEKWEEFMLVCLEDDSKKMKKIIDKEEIYMKYREIAKEVSVDDPDYKYVKASLEADENFVRVKEAKAREAGIEIGVQQGVEQTKIETAKKLYKANVSMDIIKEATGFTAKQIKNICV